MARAVFIWILAVAVLIGTAGTASATVVSLTVNELMGLTKLGPPPGGGSLVSKTAAPGALEVTYKLNSLGNGEWIQIGSKFPTASADWTAYDEFKLSFHNPMYSGNIYVNSFFNTGWTDYSEPDTFYENGGTWLQPGESTILTVDLASVSNLNHVTAFGYQAALGGGQDGWGWAQGTGDFDVVVDQVIPEPCSLIVWGLLGLGGGLGIPFLRRRKR